MSWLEAVAVVVSILGIWMSTRRLLVSWPVSILACVLYAVVFFRAKFYSDMLLQGFFILFSFYGWWNWSQGLLEKGSVIVEPLFPRGWLLGVLAGASGGIVLGLLMKSYTDASIPYIDSQLTGFSLVAQFWATRRHIANWWLWIVVDTVYAAAYVYKHLYLTAGLYVFLVVLALMGLREWSAAMSEQQKQTAR